MIYDVNMLKMKHEILKLPWKWWILKPPHEPIFFFNGDIYLKSNYVFVRGRIVNFMKYENNTKIKLTSEFLSKQEVVTQTNGQVLFFISD